MAGQSKHVDSVGFITCIQPRQTGSISATLWKILGELNIVSNITIGILNYRRINSYYKVILLPFPNPITCSIYSTADMLCVEKNPT